MSAPHPPGLPEALGWPIHPAMLSSTEHIPGFEIVQQLALVHGWSEVGLTGFGHRLAKLEEARTNALLTMLNDATRYNANAVVGIHYSVTISPVSATMIILASGTCAFARRIATSS